MDMLLSCHFPVKSATSMTTWNTQVQIALKHSSVPMVNGLRIATTIPRKI